MDTVPPSRPVVLIISQTTSCETNTFFHALFSAGTNLPDQTCNVSLLLTCRDGGTGAGESNEISQVLVTARDATIYARCLTSILHPLVHTKHESPDPEPLNPGTRPGNPFCSVNAGHALNTQDAVDPADVVVGQFVSVVSPERAAREASCSQFDAKLDSPGRAGVKGRRERRVRSLLPDIARRRRAEMLELQGAKVVVGVKIEGTEMGDDPFESCAGRGREMSVRGGRETSVVRGAREGSVLRAREGSLPVVELARDSLPPSTTELQTKQAVKQTVLAALRLHSLPPSHADYKLLISHTVSAAMFALRHKTRTGRIAGMGEIGGIVEGLLEVFLRGDTR